MVKEKASQINSTKCLFLTVRNGKMGAEGKSTVAGMRPQESRKGGRAWKKYS